MPVSLQGSLIAGRYRVVRPLGHGGMATVSLAEDQRLAERERDVEHARLLRVQVGEDDDVGAAEVGGDLGIGDEAGNQAHAVGDARGELGIPAIHSSAPRTDRNASSSTSTPL